jgi:hypothetical protein
MTDPQSSTTTSKLLAACLRSVECCVSRTGAGLRRSSGSPPGVAQSNIVHLLLLGFFCRGSVRIQMGLIISPRADLEKLTPRPRLPATIRRLILPNRHASECGITGTCGRLTCRTLQDPDALLGGGLEGVGNRITGGARTAIQARTPMARRPSVCTPKTPS